MTHTISPPVSSTKDRILDAAERLLARQGFEAASLRAITAEADVNLAAVNYHFQSKDALIRAVIARRIGPVNAKRLAMLDAIELKTPEGVLPVGPLIEAFVRPVVEVRGRTKPVAPIMGRVFAESAEFLEQFFKDHLAEVADRFRAAFTRALPDLPLREVYWRMHFLIGAMAHTMVAGEFFEKTTNGLCPVGDVDGLVRRMVQAFTAVFEAPHQEFSNEESKEA